MLDTTRAQGETLLTDPQLSNGPLVVVGGRLHMLTGTGSRAGLNENAQVWLCDIENSSFTLVRDEQYNMYSSVGSDCRLGGGAQWVEKDGALLHLTTREGCSELNSLTADGADVPLLCPQGSMDCIAACSGQARVLFVGMLDMRLQ